MRLAQAASLQHLAGAAAPGLPASHAAAQPSTLNPIRYTLQPKTQTVQVRNDILDWHGDHPHTNYHDLYDALRDAGLWLEVLGSPLTCFDASQVGSQCLWSMSQDPRDGVLTGKLPIGLGNRIQLAGASGLAPDLLRRFPGGLPEPEILRG